MEPPCGLAWGAGGWETGTLMRTADVAVIGAGPAGAAAAAVAARGGLDVVVIDKASFPRDKCCGDGLTAACLRELEALGLEPNRVASWQPIGRVVLHTPAQRRIELPLPAGPGVFSVVARRRDLDAALVDVAVKAGAELWQDEALVALTADADTGPQADGAVSLSTTTRRLRARTVIAADGMWSPTRKLCGARHRSGYRGEWHAFRQYVHSGSADAAAAQHIWFPADLLPGYVWSFPLPGGGLNIGFGFPRGGHHAVGDGGTLWRQLLTRPEIGAVLGEVVAEAPLRAWPIPARVHDVSLTALGGRVLFVGDAATAPDPMTGEGIGQALQTGRLAAESVLAHAGTAPEAHSSTAAAVAYQHAVRRDLVADHRLAKALSVILSSPRRAEWAMRAVDQNDWTRGNFARWMFEDYPRAILATPRRWRRGQFASSGAFGSNAVSDRPS